MHFHVLHIVCRSTDATEYLMELHVPSGGDKGIASKTKNSMQSVFADDLYFKPLNEW